MNLQQENFEEEEILLEEAVTRLLASCADKYSKNTY